MKLNCKKKQCAERGSPHPATISLSGVWLPPPIPRHAHQHDLPSNELALFQQSHHLSSKFTNMTLSSDSPSDKGHISPEHVDKFGVELGNPSRLVAGPSRFAIQGFDNAIS